MEIRQLKYFVEVCKYKNFSKAADACYISSQGISGSILRLENELNRQLFIREPRGVSLTPAALYLLPRAQQILKMNEECEAYFASGATYHSSLQVAFAPGSIEEFAGAMIGEFQEANPDIQFSIVECCDEDCEKAVLDGEVDLGFSCGPLSSSQLDSHLLVVSPHALIVRKDSELAKKDFVSAEDLHGLPLILLRNTTRTYSVIRQGCQMRGFEPVVDTFVDNILTVYDLAQSKRNAVGVSTMALASHLNRPMLKAIPFQDSIFNWCVHFIKPKGAMLSEPAKLFEQAVLNRLDKQGILYSPRKY